jgi:hypothetical protein
VVTASLGVHERADGTVGKINSILSIGIEKTRAVDEIIREYIRLDMQTERINYPSFDDNAWSLLTEYCFHFRHFYRYDTNYLALENYNDHVSLVKENVTEEEKQQAKAIREKALAIYKDAIVSFAVMAREYNLK